MLRFLWPLLLMFGPQLAPRVIKFVRAVWRLHKDHRVNILLKPAGAAVAGVRGLAVGFY